MRFKIANLVNADASLVSEGDSYRIRQREVVMDYADIEFPTLGLLF